ncbi:SGNH/GDSL hydrolase family protein [Ferrimonas pelagia]|uniref:SGNH/GDSL hydrolase family protein n=1 Tax=Ferrimonas pelagia TaxID=1177826 RepID=UPI0031E9779B
MIPDTISLLLAPLLIVQGKWVQWRTPRLPEADGARRGQLGQGPALSVWILGDSAAAGVGVKRQHCALSGQLTTQLGDQFQLDWQLRASSGARTKEMMALLPKQPHRVNAVVLSAGVNDVLSTSSAKRWALELDELLHHLRRQHQPELIILTPLPPMERFPAFPHPLRAWLGKRCHQFNQELSRIHQQHPCSQLLSMPHEGADLAVDQLHPGPASYRLWAAAAAEIIKNRFATAQGSSAQATSATL